MILPTLNFEFPPRNDPQQILDLVKFKPPSIQILLAIFKKGWCLILSFPRKIPPDTPDIVHRVNSTIAHRWSHMSHEGKHQDRRPVYLGNFKTSKKLFTLVSLVKTNSFHNSFPNLLIIYLVSYSDISTSMMNTFVICNIYS